MLRAMRWRSSSIFRTVDLHFVAHLQQFAGFADALPAHLGEMNKPFDAADVNKGAEVGQVDNTAVEHLAYFQLVQKFSLARFTDFFTRRAFGEDQAIALAI